MTDTMQQGQACGHEHPHRLCSIPIQSLSLAIASLNTAQIALNTAQSALQRVSNIAPHAVVVGVGPSPEEQPTTPALSRAISISDSVSEWRAALTRPPTPSSITTDERWYLVTVGRNPGVFRGSSGLMENVHNISGGNPTRFKTELEARSAYSIALEAGVVQRVTFTTVTT
ncbi:hypothetical protein BDZ94DRAFT_1309110 [Collybia nuda]|uniref:Uncharacterized protein n=1 Tax=Collybia nuda TaxID=64659 RepID=A0A9P5Y8A0_9AGAR|nr:hypothetical protein BDZ94DRAFT_1309110 [Collybia nuda]